MKILAIRLKNLTSIEGSVEIDFTSAPLASAGIFAISGPTGAGKSTILDALCLALYDKAPRFATSVESVSLADVGDNQINQSDVRNMLRRGTTEGWAEVDFLGLTGHRYRSRWSVRRARNKIEGSLRNQTLAVVNLETDEELQGTKTELLAQLVQLVGLTYDQFTRTVLLAQNDFATFLKSRGTAKAELLEKLTGTDIYSRISQEIYLRNKAMEEELRSVRERLAMIELLSEEDEAALLKERDSLREKKAVMTAKLEEWKGQLSIWQNLKHQEEQLLVKRKQEEQAMKRKEEMLALLTAKQGALEVLRRKWTELQPDVKRARELDTRIQAQTALVDGHKKMVTEAEKQVNDHQKRLETITVDSRQALIHLNRLFGETMVDLSGLDRIEEGLRQEEEAIYLRQKSNDDRATELNGLNYRKMLGDLKAREEELQLLKQVREGRLDLERLRKGMVDLKAEQEELTQQSATKKVAFETVNRLYENARLAIGKDVELLRSRLQEGEACPVCGSCSHPYSDESVLVDRLYQNVEKEYTELSGELQKLNNRLVAVQRDGVHYGEQIKKNTEQLLLWNSRLPEGVSEERLKELIEELNRRIDHYLKLETVWRTEETQIKQKRESCEKQRKQITACRLVSQQASAVAEQMELLKKRWGVEQERYAAFVADLQTLTVGRAALLKGMSADEAEAKVMAHEKELLAELDRAAKEVEGAQTQLAVLQGEINQLKHSIEELMGRKAEILPEAELQAQIKTQTEEIRQIEQTYSQQEVRVLQQEKNKALHRSVMKTIEGKEEKALQWAKLNKLIGSADGAKFKVIAQSYTLNLLLMHANHHLSYLSKRYRLQQVPNSLALQVVDGDMCDEIRTVYSLSGGESFLISLALALGLSSLSSHNLKVESLFIDEGFGSLDADSLRMAMEALEQLQMQGRKIGVISHVQEMSERLSVQVRVEKKMNGKSVLTIVG